MYFDLASKEKLEDFYDVGNLFKELKELLNVPVQRNPLIVVKGVRRVQRTSPFRGYQEILPPTFYGRGSNNLG